LSEAFQAKGIPFSTINSIKTMFEDQVIQEMNLTQTTKGGLEFPRFPLQNTRLASAKVLDPPELG
jgi:hypothetical protein